MKMRRRTTWHVVFYNSTSNCILYPNKTDTLLDKIKQRFKEVEDKLRPLRERDEHKRERADRFLP